jgi:hypothetical protein
VTLSACGGETQTNNYEVVNGIVDNGMDISMSNTQVGLPSENQTVDVPTCDSIPATGARLGGQKLSGDGHELRIDNGTEGDAIVKIRNTETGRLLTSFFVRGHTQAGVTGIPDGNYVFQYAFGTALAADCRSFTEITAANEFPSAGPMVTVPVEGGVRTRQLTYTLQPVPEGNIQPTPIDANAFNGD